ncbi:TetR/AcrR family transcriptional regulator [Arthrobacter sp. GCM10027362]|uniref:TetR/AcrR family transcriptional regulator n=1 Tax=Arthrobacter sp. GCM10027362 TaxID=3273379 RepID=UPI0036315524
MTGTNDAAIDQNRQASLQRQEILSAAERLLAKRGFDGLRLRDVSIHAGVSIGLIQHYFYTRDELVRETLETASIRRASEWAASASQAEDGPSKVKALLLGSVTDRERCTIWLETCAAASRYPEFQTLTANTTTVWRDALGQAIEQGVAEGHFELSSPVEHVVGILVGLIDGMMLAVAVQIPNYTPDYVNSLLLDVARAQLGMDFQS